MAIVNAKESDEVRIETYDGNAVTVAAERLLELYDASKEYQGKFSDAHENLLQRYDSRVSELRIYLEDRDHLNQSSTEMKVILSEIEACVTDIFRLKSVWRDADKVAGV